MKAGDYVYSLKPMLFGNDYQIVRYVVLHAGSYIALGESQNPKSLCSNLRRETAEKQLFPTVAEALKNGRQAKLEALALEQDELRQSYLRKLDDIAARKKAVRALKPDSIRVRKMPDDWTPPIY